MERKSAESQAKEAANAIKRAEQEAKERQREEKRAADDAVKAIKRAEKEAKDRQKEEKRAAEEAAIRDCRNYKVTKQGTLKRMDKGVTKQDAAMTAVRAGAESGDSYCQSLRDELERVQAIQALQRQLESWV